MAPPRYLFDRWGTCLGYIDEEERFVDREGRHFGQVVGGAAVYGRDGMYRGRFDVLGQYWNELGSFIGYLGPVVPK